MLIDKVCEMAAIMQKAVVVDDESSAKDNEKFVQLQEENKGLRELLEVCSTAKQKIIESIGLEHDDKYCQTEDDVAGDRTPTREDPE